MLTNKNTKVVLAGIVLLGGCILFYLAFYWADGVKMCSDSQGYIEMSISREPVYPAFLALCRTLFGADLYLEVAVILQCVLAGYAMWKLADMTYRYSQSRFLLPAMAVIFQVAVAFICRWIAERKAIYANEIASEGLTFALYTLFIVQLFYYLKEERNKNLAGLLVFAILLTGTRKQMLFTFALLAAVILIRKIAGNDSWKKFASLFFLLILAFLSTKVLESAYNFSLRGEWTTRKKDSAFFLVNALYIADGSDELLFEDPEIKDLFREMITQVNEQGIGFADAQNGWKRRSLHYADSYDAIGYGIAYPLITEYVSQYHPSDQVGEAVWFDYYGNGLTKILIPAHPGRLANTIFSNAVMGLVNTVANVRGFLPWFALASYLVFAILMCLFLRRKSGEAGLLLAVITFLAVGANVTCVAVTIFSQPRYMIYNMPLFYLALFWMLWDLYTRLKEKKNG